MIDTEERLRRLERFRLFALARINLLQSMAAGAWAHVALKEDDPILFAQALGDAWRAGAKDVRPFPGVDPAFLDLLHQEYEEAVEQVASQVLTHVRQEAPKVTRQKKGPGE